MGGKEGKEGGVGTGRGGRGGLLKGYLRMRGGGGEAGGKEGGKRGERNVGREIDFMYWTTSVTETRRTFSSSLRFSLRFLRRRAISARRIACSSAVRCFLV